MTQTRKHCEKYLVATALAAWWLVAGGLLTPAPAAPITEAAVRAKIERHTTVTGNAGALAKWQGVHSLLFGDGSAAMSVADLKAQVARSQGQPWQAVWDSVWEAYQSMVAQQAALDRQQQQQQQEAPEPAAPPPVEPQEAPEPQGFGSPQEEDEQEDPQQQLIGHGQQDQQDPPPPVEVTLAQAPTWSKPLEDLYSGESVKVGTDGMLTVVARGADDTDPLSSGRFSFCVNGDLCTLPPEVSWNGWKEGSLNGRQTGRLAARETEVRHRLGGIAGNDLWTVRRNGSDVYGWVNPEPVREKTTEQGRWERGGTVERQSIDHETGQLRGQRVEHAVWYWVPDQNGPTTRTRTLWVRKPSYIPVEQADLTLNRRWVAVAHDGGNDYRAFGYWMTTDYSSDQSNEEWSYAIDAASYNLPSTFAHGTNPATDISGVAGTATYRGEAAGAARAYNGVPDIVISHLHAGTLVAFDQAPVTVTANFDTNRMDTRIDLRGTWHPLDGYKGSSAAWTEDRLPSGITFRARMADDGSASLYDGPNGDPLDVRVSAAGPGRSIPGVQRSSAEFDAQFYQPDDGNAPGSVLGRFEVKSTSAANVPNTPGAYEIKGAFGAEKQ